MVLCEGCGVPGIPLERSTFCSDALCRKKFDILDKFLSNSTQNDIFSHFGMQCFSARWFIAIRLATGPTPLFRGVDSLTNMLQEARTQFEVQICIVYDKPSKLTMIIISILFSKKMLAYGLKSLTIGCGCQQREAREHGYNVTAPPPIDFIFG